MVLAASAIVAGSAPLIWPARGDSPGEVESVRSARRSPRTTCAASTRSLQVRLAPCRFINMRKHRLLCSSSGACVNGCEIRTGPIFMGCHSSLSKIAHCPPPSDFARYMARSAWCNKSWNRRQSCGAAVPAAWAGETPAPQAMSERPLSAMPTLALVVMLRPSIVAGACNRSRIRLATSPASSLFRNSSRKTVNSSPPYRAAISPGRMQPTSRRATSHKTRSPTKCPKLSLIVLKPSRSMKQTAKR